MRRRAFSLFLLAVATVAGCSQPPPEVAGEISLQMNPSGTVPLAGLLTFTTDQPVRVSLTIGDDEISNTVTPKDEFNTEHELMVLGLRAGRTNTVQIHLENENGDMSQPPALMVDTPPLPDDFPPIDVTLSRPARMEPGYTFIPIVEQAEGNIARGKQVVLDAQGEVVWWRELETLDQFKLASGNLLNFYDVNFQTVIEMDMLGNVVRRWHAANIRAAQPANSTAVAIDTVHHDLLELPSGNFLALSSEAREYENYPTSVTEPNAERKTTTVIGDVIVEFRKDGSIVREIKMLDLIDPYRLSYASLETGFYSNIYTEVLDEPGLDINHGNGMQYLEDSDSLILSLNHNDAIVKINLAENRLEWILGDPASWREPWSELLLKPVGELEWTYGQHAPLVLPSGNLMLYDNGAHGRAFPPNPQEPLPNSYSRAVEFEIDEDNMTVRQVWSYGDRDANRFFGVALGDVDLQPQTGNILVTTGAYPAFAKTLFSGGELPPGFALPTQAPGGAAADGEDAPPPPPPEALQMIAVITEVTHTDPPEKVWEISIEDPAQGYIVYRSERMPSLYP